MQHSIKTLLFAPLLSPRIWLFLMVGKKVCVYVCCGGERGCILINSNLFVLKEMLLPTVPGLGRDLIMSPKM